MSEIQWSGVFRLYEDVQCVGKSLVCDSLDITDSMGRKWPIDFARLRESDPTTYQQIKDQVRTEMHHERRLDA